MKFLAGVDFGDLTRIQLTPLRGIEMSAISSQRLYLHLLKVAGANAGSGEQEVMRGQAITFEQPGLCQEVGNKMSVPHLDMHTKVSIMFVGPRGQLEKRLKLALPFGDTLHNPDLENMLEHMLAFEILKVPGYVDVPDYLDSDEENDYLRKARNYYPPCESGDVLNHEIPNSFLNKVYKDLNLQESDDVVGVEVESTNADPAEQQQQSAAVHGSGPPCIGVSTPVALESIYIGKRHFVGASSDSGKSAVLLAAREIITGEDDVSICVEFCQDEIVHLTGLSNDEASLNGLPAFISCIGDKVLAPVDGFINVRLKGSLHSTSGLQLTP